MHKKSFILVSAILFVLCIFSSVVFANVDDMKNSVSNTANTVIDGVNNIGSDVRNEIGAAENGIEGALKMDDNTNSSNNNAEMRTSTNAGNYVSTRTATEGLTATNDNWTTWVWIIVAIAAIVIIGLVWYYGAQNNNNTHNNE